MLGRKLALIFLFIFSFQAVHAKEASPHFTPFFVSITRDGHAEQGYYHCFQDEEKKIWVAVDDLDKMGFPASPKQAYIYHNKAYNQLDWYSGIVYDINLEQLVLTLQTPLAWHQGDTVTTIPLDNIGFRPSRPGLFLNYDLAGGFHGYHNETAMAAFTEAGFFSRYGVLLSSFLYNNIGPFTLLNNIKRLDTTWIIDQPEHITTWRLGDSISSGLAWNSAVRFGGIQFGTNFETQPQLVTFPQPSIRGEAVLPSTVDIIVNGNQLYQQSVDRGIYNLSQLPVITGAGNIQVLTTDMLGRQKIANFSYYASPVLLKAGLANYSFELGSIRSWYGFESYGYGRAMGVGTYSLGLTNNDTLGFHAELLKEHQNLGILNNYLLGSYGVVSVGAAASYTNTHVFDSPCEIKKGVGGLLNLGFRRQTDFLSFGVQMTLATNNYMQLGTFNNRGYPNFTLQSFVGLATENLGSFALTYTDLNNAFSFYKAAPYEYLNPDAKVFMLSYNRKLWHNLFLNLSVLTDLKSNDKQIFASLILPLDGGDKSVSLNEYSLNDMHQENLQLIKNLPLGNGYGYRLTLADNNSTPIISEVDVQTNQGLFGARYVNTNWNHNVELTGRGSVVHFAGKTVLSRFIDQGFALVEVPGFADVNVYYRNQLISKTDKNGFLYVPELLAYQQNEIKIETRGLPLNARIPESSQTVVPYRKSGVYLRFEVELAQNILLTLLDTDDQPVPAGAMVYLDDQPQVLPLGYDGKVFISARPKAGYLSGHAEWPNHICHFKLKLRPSSRVIQKRSIRCY